MRIVNCSRGIDPLELVVTLIPRVSVQRHAAGTDPELEPSRTKGIRKDWGLRQVVGRSAGRHGHQNADH